MKYNVWSESPMSRYWAEPRVVKRQTPKQNVESKNIHEINCLNVSKIIFLTRLPHTCNVVSI